MTIPTLTWVKSSEQIIPCAGATVTYAEQLNKIKALIDASTYWNAFLSLDAGNNRGYIELRPKSVTVGITEGRCIYCVANAPVTGAAGSERPLQANRLAPWATATTTLSCKQWVGFSPNAATTGPDNDPWGGTTGVYTGGAKVWSKLLGMNLAVPLPNQTMWVMESAEVISVGWTANSNQVACFTFGKIIEAVDGNSADWGLIVQCQGDSSAAIAPWNTVPSATDSAPLGAATAQSSAGVVARTAGVMQKTDGTLYGFGRTQFDTLITVGAGYSNINDALLQAIIVSGGIYTSGGGDTLIGLLRQIRWGGPLAMRGQRLIDNVGATQALYLNFSLSATQKGGLWFHNSR